MPDNDKLFVGTTKVKSLEWGDITMIGLQQKDLDLMSKYINKRGYVNIEVKTSKGGNIYTEIDTYGLDKDAQAPIAAPNDESEGLPF